MLRHISSSLVYFLATAACAQELTPKLESFAPFLGNWSCLGENSATRDSSAFSFNSRFVFKPVLGGQFLQVAYTESASDALPIARNNLEFWGSEDGRYTSTFFNVFGQSGSLVSDGQKDGTLVWAGKIATPNGVMPFEGRIRLNGNDHLAVSPTLLLPSGEEFTIADLECQRTE